MMVGRKVERKVGKMVDWSVVEWVEKMDWRKVAQLAGT